MRLTILLILITVFNCVAEESYSQLTKLSVINENATLLNVIRSIENQSDFNFFYNEKESIPFSLDNQQTIGVKGIVSDASTGEPMVGVNITIKGTSIGTITGSDGRYSLNNISASSILVFSFIGYVTQEIPLNGKTTLDVALNTEMKGLDEVVVIGYGTMKKSDITGSVSSVPMDLIKNQPMRSVSDILSGRVAGMVLSRTSGDLGGPSKIRIRGANSILGSNAPLTVVDGVIGGSVGSVHDIASIEVLKDASATAIYGERASNGVILITTKKATSEKPEIRMTLNTGFISPRTKYPDKMTAGEFATFLNDFHNTEVYSPVDIEEFKRTGGTNWIDMVTQTGMKKDYNISYSQKMSKLGVYLSSRYTDEQGVIVNSSTGGDYSVRSSVDFTPNTRLTFNLDLKAGKYESKNGGLSTGSSKDDPIFQSLVWSPTEPVWDDEENKLYHVRDRYAAMLDNPYMYAMEQDRFNQGKWANATFIGDYKITDWLAYNVTGFAANSSYQSGSYRNKWLRPTDPDASRSGSESFSWRLVNRLDFKKTFWDAHNLMVTGVYEAEAGESNYVGGNVRNMPLPELAKYYAIGISNVQSIGSSYGKWSRIAYLVRLNYNYLSRYYLTASYRVDGQSGPVDRLEENKFGAFPALNVSWRLSEEPFMKGGFFDNLKLRLGWGLTGNPSGFPYTTMARSDYNFGLGAKVLGYKPGTPANPRVKWETTAQTNIGIDFTILKEKLSVTMDYFNKKTTDLLTRLNLPAYYGYGKDASYTQNLGEISNKGFETTIDYIPIQTSNFFWGMNFNFSRIRNEVVSLGDQDAFLTGGRGNGLMEDEAYRVAEGLPLGTMWGLKYLGVWKTGEAEEAMKYGENPGDRRFEDVNNDSNINLADDGQKIGDANPDFIWGLNNSFVYKNIELNLTLQGMHGQNVFNVMRAIMSVPHPDARGITLKSPAFDYWTPERQDTEWPSIHSTSSMKKLNSSQWIEDGSWVKIKHIGITYTIPRKIIKFADMNATLSGSDLLTFTKYKGLDPEVSASGSSDLFGGMDFGTVPIPRTITLGLSLIF